MNGLFKTKGSADILAEDTAKNYYGDVAVEFTFGQIIEIERYKEKVREIFDNIRFIEDLSFFEYKGGFSILFRKTRKRSWLKKVKTIETCLKSIDEDGFVRIRIFKDVHIYDGVYKERTDLFECFVSLVNPLPTNLLANILYCA